MRSITLALALLLALSVGAYAQPAANGEVAYTHPAVNVGVSAGVLLGSLTETEDDDEALSSGALGYYIAGGAALAELPIAISASYATFSPDKIKVSGGRKPTTSTRRAPSTFWSATASMKTSRWQRAGRLPRIRMSRRDPLSPAARRALPSARWAVPTLATASP